MSDVGVTLRSFMRRYGSNFDFALLAAAPARGGIVPKVCHHPTPPSAPTRPSFLRTCAHRSALCSHANPLASRKGHLGDAALFASTRFCVFTGLVLLPFAALAEFISPTAPCCQRRGRSAPLPALHFFLLPHGESSPVECPQHACHSGCRSTLLSVVPCVRSSAPGLETAGWVQCSLLLLPVSAVCAQLTTPLVAHRCRLAASEGLQRAAGVLESAFNASCFAVLHVQIMSLGENGSIRNSVLATPGYRSGNGAEFSFGFISRCLMYRGAATSRGRALQSAIRNPLPPASANITLSLSPSLKKHWRRSAAGFLVAAW